MCRDPMPSYFSEPELTSLSLLHSSKLSNRQTILLHFLRWKWEQRRVKLETSPDISIWASVIPMAAQYSFKKLRLHLFSQKLIARLYTNQWIVKRFSSTSCKCEVRTNRWASLKTMAVQYSEIETSIFVVADGRWGRDVGSTSGYLIQASSAPPYAEQAFVLFTNPGMTVAGATPG